MSKVYEMKNGKRIIYDKKLYDEFCKFILNSDSCVTGINKSKRMICFGTKEKLN